MTASPRCHRCGHASNEHDRARRCGRCDCERYTENLRGEGA